MIKDFRQFVTEAKISASGFSAERHISKYVKPFLPGKPSHEKGSHTLGGDVGHLKKGDAVTIHSHSVKDGKHHVTISHASGGPKVETLVSKLNKPFSANNKGLEQESHLVSHLNKHGLMKGSGAGSTAGNDFVLLDRRGMHEKKIPGSQGVKTRKTIEGEHKSHIRGTAFGQLTVTRHPETGKWHISDKARKRRPRYAAAIEKATVTGPDGKNRSILDHLNHHEPHHGEGNKSGFYSNPTDLHPAHEYLKDHDVHVVHIDSHGTYRAGISQKQDHHKLKLPTMKGEGRFRVRQKQDNPNSRNIQFEIRKLEKSPVNIGTDEGAVEIKKRLGHYKMKGK